MSNENNTLFVRGNETDTEDLWDDTALIHAYDKAVNFAKKEVAKRIASEYQDKKQTKQTSQNSKHSNQTKKFAKKWNVGAPCRAIYSEDGEIYEAIITKIYENSGMCKVKFIGYRNIEKVELNSLLESKGIESQIAQEKAALEEKTNRSSLCDSDTSTYSTRHNFEQMNGERMDYDTENSRFKNNFTHGPFFDLTVDGIPPAPPLPPQLMAKLPENDTEALSSMLMSWYISGFHTGYYHGMKQAKINQQKGRNSQ